MKIRKQILENICCDWLCHDVLGRAVNVTYIRCDMNVRRYEYDGT